MGISRIHSPIDPNIVETRTAISYHIDDIARLFDRASRLRRLYEGYNFPTEAEDGWLYFDGSTYTFYVRENGQWKHLSFVTVSTSEPDISKIQSYHLWYNPNTNSLKFFLKDGDSVSWIELYPESISPAVGAIPKIDSSGRLDKNWWTKYNPINLANHTSEQNALKMLKGDRAYLILNNQSEMDIYLDLKWERPQLFDIVVAGHNISGSALYPNFQSQSFKQAGFYYDNNTYHTLPTTEDKVRLCDYDTGIAFISMTVDDNVALISKRQGSTDTTNDITRIMTRSLFGSFDWQWLGKMYGAHTNSYLRMHIERIG